MKRIDWSTFCCMAAMALRDLGGHGPLPLQRRADVAENLDAALHRFLLKFHSGTEGRLEGFHGLLEQVARLVLFAVLIMFVNLLKELEKKLGYSYARRSVRYPACAGCVSETDWLIQSHW